MPFDDFHPSFVTVREHEGAAVVEFLLARLSDDYNIEQLGHELFALVGQYGCRRMAVDLSSVRHLTSSVLGKFITLHRRLYRDGGLVVFCGLTDEVIEVMRTSRLLDYFHIAPDVEAAVARLQEPPDARSA